MKTMKLYHVLSSNSKIEEQLIKLNSNNSSYISFNSSLKFSNTSYTVFDYLTKINTKNNLFEENRNVNCIDVKFFKLFLQNELNNFDVFYISSTGLSFESIKIVSLFYEKVLINTQDKKVFFIHNVEELDENEIIIKIIEKDLISEIKKYKTKNRKKLMF